MDAKAIHERLVAAFGERIQSANFDVASPFVVIVPDALLEVATFCRNERDLLFDNLMCLSAVDYPKETPPRMELVYHLLSYTHGHTFAFKVYLPREEPRAASVEGVWGVANWHEREAYDLFGIAFTGHSDLRRILLPDDWVGHPLRKDWQDPDFYNGLHVKPTPQMAERFLGGEAIGVGPFNFTPPNRHVADDDPVNR
jgi:NADH-quinone oxidoreductase subunit C